MSIPAYARANLDILLRAAITGDPRYVLCAVGRDDGDYVMTPFGHLAPGNPFEAYLPPDTSPDGGDSLPA